MFPYTSSLITALAHTILRTCCSKTIAGVCCRFVLRSVIAIGTCMAVFGFLIYYLLPLALLSLNLALFITIFFWILVGTFIGLVMLALNVEILLEVIPIACLRSC